MDDNVSPNVTERSPDLYRVVVSAYGRGERAKVRRLRVMSYASAREAQSSLVAAFTERGYEEVRQGGSSQLLVRGGACIRLWSERVPSKIAGLRSARLESEGRRV